MLALGVFFHRHAHTKTRSMSTDKLVRFHNNKFDKMSCEVKIAFIIARKEII